MMMVCEDGDNNINGGRLLRCMYNNKEGQNFGPAPSLKEMKWGIFLVLSSWKIQRQKAFSYFYSHCLSLRYLQYVSEQ